MEMQTPIPVNSLGYQSFTIPRKAIVRKRGANIATFQIKAAFGDEIAIIDTDENVPNGIAVIYF